MNGRLTRKAKSPRWPSAKFSAWPCILNRHFAVLDDLHDPFTVKRAFLWMFIRSSWTLKLRNLSLLAKDRMDNLLKAHI
jgi:hypothetical protein